MNTRDPFAPWAEVDLDAIAANLGALRGLLRPGTRLLAAVKADAYGHGADAVARTALAAGADALGVARLDEALALRRAGIDGPILVFGTAAATLAPEYAAHGVAASVSDRAEAAALSAHLRPGQRLELHLELDTGMGRLGLLVQGGDPERHAARIAAEVAAIQALPGILLQGLATHFPDADRADGGASATQLRILEAALRMLRARGCAPPLVHAANSAGILRGAVGEGGMVRAGLALYGLDPSPDCAAPITLRPALALKARVLHLKRVPAGTTIGYGRTHRTTAPTVIATVPIGYGDGYPRALSNRGEMLVGGRRVPIAGRVCMDLCMLDLGPGAEAAVGDEVVAIGAQEGARIHAHEVAERAGTISYEIVTALSPRVRRRYLHSDAAQRERPRQLQLPIAC